MSNENTTTAVLAPTDERIAKLEDAAKRAAVIETKYGADTIGAALCKANALATLRRLITPEIMQQAVLPLQGTRIGFLTDRDNDRDGPYPEGVVKDAVIEAMMAGVPLIGNRFNILGKRFYLTREGVAFKLDRFPGLTYEITPAIPTDERPPEYVRMPDGKSVLKKGEATVCVSVTWKVAGADKEENCRLLSFRVSVNRGMSTEAVQGKAWCRAAKWLWTKVSGYDVAVTDGEGVTIDVPAEDVTPAPEPPPVKKHPPSAATEKDRVLDAIRKKQPHVNQPPTTPDQIPEDITAAMSSDAPEEIPGLDD